VKLPQASFARMRERSSGKDTIIGHWEIAGVISPQPLPTYPDGFPPELLDDLRRLIGRDVLCGLPYSGTQVLTDYGQEHVLTGSPIVYTSADSVLQIAAHERVIPLERQYEICELARKMMQGERAVGRIIARPFIGTYPHYSRTQNRRDYALIPPHDTMLDLLSKRWLDVIGVGKIYDIFAGRGLTQSIKMKDNDDGMRKTIQLVGREWAGLCFVNLVDFDMTYGHRNDVDGYARAISAFDVRLGELVNRLQPDDAVILTADHGCDPSTPSTDHSREYAPMLMFGRKIRPGVNLGTRPTFADIAATVQEYFELPVETRGNSFLRDVQLD
jgi:phosphopentomutase